MPETVVARRLASLNDAAAYAHVNPRTIRRRIADGSLPAYRVGLKLIRVDLDDVDQLLTPIPVGAA